MTDGFCLSYGQQKTSNCHSVDFGWDTVSAWSFSDIRGLELACYILVKYVYRKMMYKSVCL